MPKTQFLAAVSAVALSALALGACDGDRQMSIRSDGGGRGGVLKAATQLECPEHQGPLTRTRTAPDGLSCVYAGPKGAEVTLRLVKLDDGGAAAVLTPLEAELNRLMPGVADKIAKARVEERKAEAEARVAEAESRKAELAALKAEAESERAEALAERAAALAEGDAAAAEAAAQRAQRAADAVKARAEDEERVTVSMPGMNVRTEGEDAHVRLPGIRIDTKGDSADVRIGPMTIKADDKSGNVSINANDTEMTVNSNDDASEIRTVHTGDGTRATFILVDEAPSNQSWKLVGYEARGPQGGPLVIAVVKAKDRREDDVFDAAKALVRRNAGGGR